jgi:hypothetical protein
MAEVLNELGIRTPSGQSWTQPAVSRLIRAQREGGSSRRLTAPGYQPGRRHWQAGGTGGPSGSCLVAVRPNSSAS